MNELTNIQKRLFELADLNYKKFNSGLIPTVNKSTIIGVRTPDLRHCAKQIAKSNEADRFLSELPHKYYEENNLHCYIIEQITDFDTVITETEKILPFIDNWSTCDTFSPKVFKKNTPKLLPYIEKWLKSNHTYTVRFAVLLLMKFFLDENFDVKYLSWVANVPTEDYYLHMVVAWYYATALAKQYDATLPFIKNRRLYAKTHNKTIQKAIESYRITDNRKVFLKTLKIQESE